MPENPSRPRSEAQKANDARNRERFKSLWEARKASGSVRADKKVNSVPVAVPARKGLEPGSKGSRRVSNPARSGSNGSRNPLETVSKPSAPKKKGFFGWGFWGL